MLAVFRSTRFGPTVWARRVALLALFALELAVTISPLLEPHHQAPETHAEQSGTTHHYVVHNEATCAVCTLRSIGQLPTAVSSVIVTALPIEAATARRLVAALARRTAAHTPRAPPLVA